MDRLQTMLHESKEAAKALGRQQLNLEEDIQIKTNSLAVDRANVALRAQIQHKKF